MRMRFFACAIVGIGLAQATNNVWAQFPTTPPFTDSTTSLGQFVLVLNPSLSGAFVGSPGYSASANTLTSPLLFDQSTMINRSAPLVLGNSTTASAPVGTPVSGMVSSNSGDTALMFSGNIGPNVGLSYPVPAGSGATSPNTDSVFTQINSFALVGGGVSVLAGASAMDPNLPASVGQVTSNAGHSTSGTSAADFPARSFFDIFVDIDIPLPPALGGGTGALTNATVYSGSNAITPPGMPLMIANSGITSFPPVVIYTHGNSSAVPVYIESGPFAGDIAGLLILAGHGAGYGSSAGTAADQNTGKPADQTTFQQTIMQEYSSGDTLPVPPQYSTWVTPYTPVEVLPEPSSIALALVAFGGLAVYRLRRRRRRTS
jgi:hypothetical protein